MTITIEFTQVISKEVKYLKAECGVRYWEDGEVNGTEDTDGELIPFRVKDAWCPTIDLETGMVQDWPAGTTADLHYKVCDAGRYFLLDAEKSVVREIEGYVPEMMSPGDNGYGDYVIMTIGPDGQIANWKVELDEFQEDAE
ncbi:hypothetical protein G6M04_14620 [Agrobacterium rhizogenes]|uniref:hypothetical protein n=1 Tax=Rhizobium rhizogenes TaxID=359 RepID=UPI0015739D7E|nr:hypothetical protein [Rhizobium rhizogenes]NTG48624.1 hypothetical protein [Rhizobium rhizogenes]